MFGVETTEVLWVKRGGRFRRRQVGKVKGENLPGFSRKVLG